MPRRRRGRADSFAVPPFALVALALGAIALPLTAEIFFEGLKAGLLTFGGAFTVIPFLQESAVDGQGWLTDSQFVDGLAIGGVLPAPLIIFSTFVGYLAGGLGGGLAMTLGIFLPAFVLPIFFHRFLVAVAENERIRPFLLGVAAGVIGLIAAVTVTIVETGVVDLPTAPDGGGSLPRSQPLALEADRPLRGARLRRDRRHPATHRALDRGVRNDALGSRRMGDRDPLPTPGEHLVRRAGIEDAADVARLLHDFNTEFDEPTPDVPTLTERARQMLGDGVLTVLLVGEGPDGLAQMRFLPSIWSSAPSCFLEELYVAPPLRGRGMGRALLEAAMEAAREAGADHIDLNTGETDTAARALYESVGFTNREGGEDGPRMLYYERDL